MIAEVLQRHSFEDKWLPTVSAMLDTCRLTPLIGESLSQIPPTRRLPEMGFTLYMDDSNWTTCAVGLPQAKQTCRPNASKPRNCLISMICKAI